MSSDDKVEVSAATEECRGDCDGFFHECRRCGGDGYTECPERVARTTCSWCSKRMGGGWDMNGKWWEAMKCLACERYSPLYCETFPDHPGTRVTPAPSDDPRRTPGRPR